MSSLPSRNEILEKYRAVIDREDFEILTQDHLPRPEELQQGDVLQYLGTLKGAAVWAKRNLGHVILVFVIAVQGVGGFIQGLESIAKYGQIAWEQVPPIMQFHQQHPDIPATEYKIVERQHDWPLPPEQPFWINNSGTTTTTSTTTSSPEYPSPIDSMPSGSGLVPYSDRWQKWA
jgi:hypothetical protein